MLELGRARTAGGGKGSLPVLRDGSPVGVLRPYGWRTEATAEAGGRSLVFGARGGELTGRDADADPADAVRFRTRMTSLWTGTWAQELDGAAVEMRTTSWWRGARRYTTDGRTVAESASTGWLRRPTLTADDVLPRKAPVFLLWVELVILRRSGGAVPSGAVAAGVAS